MKRVCTYCILLILSCIIYGQLEPSKTLKAKTISLSKTPQTNTTIKTRFPIPDSYKRIQVNSSSFGHYLRNLPLKPKGSVVRYYNGQTKPNNNIYAAVVDLPIGTSNLHQCADAIIRLRAEYLFDHKRYNDIHFNFTNGFRADYEKWRKGNRINVNGNTVDWIPKTSASDSPESFWKYLEMVFSYAGTASLEKELHSISISEMEIGAVFIQGGFPGHAVIIVDIAENKDTGEQLFLLAQSYMPAQEIQILQNPNNNDLSPWYRISQIETVLRTPEWVFKKDDLKQFAD